MTNMETQEQIKISQDDILDVLNNPEIWPSLSINPNKGFLLIGNTGVGKTYAIDRWLKYGTIAYKKIDSEDIEFGVQKEGAQYLEKIKWQRTIFWDDLGYEPLNQMYMGTSLTPGTNLLQNRYKFFIEGGWKTHATTNLLPEELTQRYGERFLSRMKEMFNVIIVYGEDRRK